MTTRERADILSMRLLQRDGNPVDKIESALREVENEALERAAQALPAHPHLADGIRALKQMPVGHGEQK